MTKKIATAKKSAPAVKKAPVSKIAATSARNIAKPKIEKIATTNLDDKIPPASTKTAPTVKKTPAKPAKKSPASPEKPASVASKKNVFIKECELETPPKKSKEKKITLPKGWDLNKRLKKNGLDFLKKLPEEQFPIVFFDPQYRGILDKQRYGNEGKRQKLRANLEQMSSEIIGQFIEEIQRILVPSGHLFLWVDKFILCESSIHPWIQNLPLSIVDLITWNKERIGMGYRSRRKSEYLVVIQKKPTRAKGVWKKHDIPDVWSEKVERIHAHNKPILLQKNLIESCSDAGDIIVDPAAGSFSVLTACQESGRHFLGCDIVR